MANTKIFKLVEDEGRSAPDLMINPTNIPSTAEKASFANVPTADEKAALVGTSGTAVSVSNKLVDNTDTRMSDSRTPLSHDNTLHSATYITAAGVTYENLNTNSDIGQAASTVAAGDDARFPTADEKAACAGPSGYTPSVDDPYVTKSYADTFNEWIKSVDYTVDYVKTDAGAPSGTPVADEQCLNTNEDKLYEESGLAWNAGVAVTTGQRFIHKDTGDDSTGDSGTQTKSDKIYDFSGTAQTYTEITPTLGSSVMIDELGTGGQEWKYDGSNWTLKASTVIHNALSSKQGGTTDEFYHITSDQEASMDAADTLTAANYPLALSNRAMMACPVDFVFMGSATQFAASRSEIEFFNAAGIVQQETQHKNGSIVGIKVQISSARTAGTLTVEPTIDGVKVTPTDLDVVINDVATIEAIGSIAPATTGYTFTSTQGLGVKVTSDASWAYGFGDIQVTLFVVFDS